MKDRYGTEISSVSGDTVVITAFGTGFIQTIDREAGQVQILLDGGGVVWLEAEDVEVILEELPLPKRPVR